PTPLPVLELRGGVRGERASGRGLAPRRLARRTAVAVPARAGGVPEARLAPRRRGGGVLARLRGLPRLRDGAGVGRRPRARHRPWAAGRAAPHPPPLAAGVPEHAAGVERDRSGPLPATRFRLAAARRALPGVCRADARGDGGGAGRLLPRAHPAARDRLRLPAL